MHAHAPAAAVLHGVAVPGRFPGRTASCLPMHGGPQEVAEAKSAASERGEGGGE
jgi:hypothetical protein